MAVDSHWRLYYNETWVRTPTVEENATLVIHEVSHLLRDHEARKKATGARDHRRWNTAATARSTTNLHDEVYRCRAIRRCPSTWPESGKTRGGVLRPLQAAPHSKQTAGRARTVNGEPGSCRPTKKRRRHSRSVPAEGELWRRDVARRIVNSRPTRGMCRSLASLAKGDAAPKVDYMATIRHAVRRALRDSTLAATIAPIASRIAARPCYGIFSWPASITAAAAGLSIARRAR